MKRLEGIGETLSKFMESGKRLTQHRKPNLKRFGQVLTVATALVATSACVAPPSGPDRPGNTNQRVTESSLLGAIIGAAVTKDNTKNNVIGGLLGAAIGGGVAYHNSQKQAELNQTLRDAGIQAIELPNHRRYSKESSVLLQLHPEATHKPGQGKHANASFSNSMIAVANAVDYYIQSTGEGSYRDVEVLYAMPEGCSQEARNNAHALQSWLHSAVDLPVGVNPLITVDGTLTYNDVVSQNRQSNSLMGRRTRSNDNFRVDRGAGCPDDAEGSVNVVMNGLKR